MTQCWFPPLLSGLPGPQLMYVKVWPLPVHTNVFSTSTSVPPIQLSRVSYAEKINGNGEKNILSWYLGAWINVFTPWDCVSNTCRSFSRSIIVWTDCRFICNMTQIRSLQFDPLTQIATIFWQSTKRFELMKWFFNQIAFSEKNYS